MCIDLKIGFFGQVVSMRQQMKMNYFMCHYIILANLRQWMDWLSTRED
jgi:hypothetical protein